MLTAIVGINWGDEGKGRMVDLLSADYDVVGIDYSYEMVARATENASRTGVQPVFMRMDAQSMTFADESFDLIVSRDVLWNLEYLKWRWNKDH